MPTRSRRTVGFKERVVEFPSSPKKMVEVRMPSVHNCTAMESCPRGSERWKVSKHSRVVVLQLCPWDPLSLRALQVTLSGRREELPMV